MYKTPKHKKSSIKRYEAVQGEPIEHKIERILNNKEPIKDGAPIIFSERKDGINPAYDIRTDRFDIACDAMDAVHRSEVGKRMNRIKEKEVIKLEPEKGGEAKSTQGTNE